MTRRLIKIQPEDLDFAPAGTRRTLEIHTSDVPPSIQILQPADGSVVHSAHLTIRGLVHPRGEICLLGDGIHLVRIPQTTGAFELKNVRLEPLRNSFTIGRHGASCVSSVGRVSLVVHLEDPYLAHQDRDPYVKQPFKRGDDVVRCNDCRTYFLRSTVLEDPYCSVCGASAWISLPDPRYYEPKLHI